MTKLPHSANLDAKISSLCCAVALPAGFAMGSRKRSRNGPLLPAEAVLGFGSDGYRFLNRNV